METKTLSIDIEYAKGDGTYALEKSRIMKHSEIKYYSGKPAETQIRWIDNAYEKPFGNLYLDKQTVSAVELSMYDDINFKYVYYNVNFGNNTIDYSAMDPDPPYAVDKIT